MGESSSSVRASSLEIRRVLPGFLKKTFEFDLYCSGRVLTDISFIDALIEYLGSKFGLISSAAQA